MATIDPRFIVNLKGKDFPTWPGVLDLATRSGLRSLTTTVIQIPGPENNHTAVVMARAEFEDGRVFEDVGDASPANCSAPIATAALRMASTRAKGRVLRDALNIGQTLLEELPDEEREPSGNGHARAQAAPRTAPGSHAGYCEAEGCGNSVTESQALLSEKKYARLLCPVHQKGATAVG